MSRVRTAGTSSSFCGDGAAGFWWHAGFGVVSASWGCFSDLLVKNPVISDAPPPPALVDPGATPPLPFDDTLLFFEGGVSQAAAIALFFVCTTSAGGATQAPSCCCSIQPHQVLSQTFAAFFSMRADHGQCRHRPNQDLQTGRGFHPHPFFWLVGLFCFRHVRYFDRHASNHCCRIYLVRALCCAGARGSRRCRTCWLRPHARISRCGSHRSAELSPPWIAREEANDISERDDDDDQARLGYEDDHGDGRRGRGKNGGGWQEVADSDAQNRRGQELGGGRHGPHSEAIHVWSHKHTHKHEANTHTGKTQNSAPAAQVTTRCGTRPAASCAALLCHATIARGSPPLFASPLIENLKPGSQNSLSLEQQVT